ncbi:hypothetical protein VTL71DRAFT_2828 [Oculimacula yallundae]|uniref:Kelch repeat protein n=1 Tax=Oculimacula yallundae TaxID=86028 RepID=A0ABR4CBC1_9HELO
MFSGSCLSGIAAFSLFVSVAKSSLTAWNVPASNLVRQLWMTSIIVGDSLYIEGGEHYITGATSYSDIKYPPTRSIDLSKSWTTSSVVINQIDKSTTSACNRTISHPGLFWQESTRSILVFGGDTTTSGTVKTACALTLGDSLGSESWVQVYNSSDSIWKTITWPRQPSFAYSPTASYALGGFTKAAGDTTASMLMSMAVMNKTTGSFQAQSEVGEFSTTGGVNQGEGHFVPSFGGLVIFIGGVAYSDAVVGASLRSMSKIDIYNPSTQKWYTQSASGDVPSGRKNFCMTGAQGKNQSTYEIFVYGGAGLEFFSDANSDSRNVYILTLPAFRWIRTTALSSPRAGSSCQTVKNQMISYGGYDPTGVASYARLDPWAYGIGIFDLNTLEWGFNYNSNAAGYVQSDVVSKVYASGALYPTWDDDNLAVLFKSSAASTTNPASPTIPNQSTATIPPSGATSAPASSDSSKTPVAAIAGGTVGGVAFLALVILGLWYWMSRRRETGEAGTREEKVEIGTRYTEPVATELHGDTAYPELSSEQRVPELAGGYPSVAYR